MNINQTLGSAVPSAQMTLPRSHSLLREGSRALFFTKGKFFTQAVLNCAPLLEQSQSRNARPWRDLGCSLASHKRVSEHTLPSPCQLPGRTPALQTEPLCVGSSARSKGKHCQPVQPALRNSQINAVLFNNPISFS